jgi:hypothetical protein
MGFNHETRQEFALPQKISLDQYAGFSLCMPWSLLSGHSDEIVVLADINLFRKDFVLQGVSVITAGMRSEDWGRNLLKLL